MADGSHYLRARRPAPGAGVVLRAPTGHLLFLQRGQSCDEPGTWCWPGGTREGGEDGDETALRELEEETGYVNPVFTEPMVPLFETEAFETYLMDVPADFEPVLNDEHVDWLWALPGEAPEPLHPGVEEMLTTLAMDEWNESQHPRDDDGKFGSGGGSSSLSTGKSGASGGVEASYDPATKSWTAEGVEPARLKALAIPPAWTKVRIAPDPAAALQVVGFDAKGRAQYRYSAEHAKSQAAKKFARVANLVKQRANLDARSAEAVEAGSPTAAAVRMMLLTGMRPGSDADTKATEKAYGATTLLKEHVKVEGDDVHYEFTGKKGVRIIGRVNDPTLAGYVKTALAEPGDRLFKTTAAQANAFIKDSAGSDYKAKDLRTLKANEVAAEAVAGRDPPKTERERAAAIKEVATIVSKQLGNTPAIALKDYINEMVFSPWRLAA